MPKEEKAEYAPSTEQLYKESLRENGDDKKEDERKGREMIVEGNDVSAYVGVDPVYQNYANESEKPYAPEEGSADAAIVEEFVAAQTHTVSTVEGENTNAEGNPATPESTETKPTLTTPASRPTDSRTTKKS